MSYSGTNWYPSADFTPNRLVTVRYYVGNATTPAQIKTVTAQCNGTVMFTVTTASSLLTRTDRVTATDGAGRSFTATITILIL